MRKKIRKERHAVSEIPPTPFKQRGLIRPELIAPAGNLEKMKTAFAFGADAVYAGIPDFSLRVRINNFNIDSLKEAIKYAHGINKKIYVTINIFAHNKHLKKLPAYIKELKKAGSDGLIVSDPGVAAEIKKYWPKAKFHLSTQANCTNWRAAEFWQKSGFKRIVLGRETTLDEIKEIRKRNPKLEIETFVHGAMCMAYSGRCFLSKYFTGRSANQGDCIQPCRCKYNLKTPQPPFRGGAIIRSEGQSEELELVEEEHGSYILNSHDLCLIKRLPELVDAGISFFKIEGRAKSVYYLACVIGAYRRAIDEVIKSKVHKVKSQKSEIFDFLFKELDEKLFHRGYTEGFMFEKGKLAQNLENSHKLPEWEFCGQALGNKSRKQKNSKTKNLINIKVHNSIKVGDRIEIVAPGYDIIKMKVKKIKDAETGEDLAEAHGGQKRIVAIEANKAIPEYSVVRRKI